MMLGLGNQIDNCQNFWWYEALRLPKWGIHCWPKNLEHRDNIIRTARKLELIRGVIGKPMVITSWYRPVVYNKLIGGASNSAHIDGLACDFVVRGMTIEDATFILKSKLDHLKIRMEDHSGNWLHIDLREPGPGGRFFKP